jgi:hypothetical protein
MCLFILFLIGDSSNDLDVEMIINMNKKTVRFKENGNLIPYKIIHIPPKVTINVL